MPGAFSAALILSAYLCFAVASAVLTLIDLTTHRLPNAIVLPSTAVFGTLLLLTTLLDTHPPVEESSPFIRALLGGVSLLLFYALLWFLQPGSMGFGDVKLAALIGLALGWMGWAAVIVGTAAAFVGGGIHGVVTLLGGRAGRKSRIPFGPWMLVGAWIGIVAGQHMADWYLELLL